LPGPRFFYFLFFSCLCNASRSRVPKAVVQPSASCSEDRQPYVLGTIDLASNYCGAPSRFHGSCPSNLSAPALKLKCGTNFRGRFNRMYQVEADLIDASLATTNRPTAAQALRRSSWSMFTFRTSRATGVARNRSPPRAGPKAWAPALFAENPFGARGAKRGFESLPCSMARLSDRCGTLRVCLLLRLERIRSRPPGGFSGMQPACDMIPATWPGRLRLAVRAATSPRGASQGSSSLCGHACANGGISGRPPSTLVDPTFRSCQSASVRPGLQRVDIAARGLDAGVCSTCGRDGPPSCWLVVSR